MAIQTFIADLEAEGSRRLERFAASVEANGDNIGPAKPFVFPCGRCAVEESPAGGSISAIEWDVTDEEMREREKALSAELRRIKAMTFMLESQRNTIRKRIAAAPA
jgi:hypothetical protein